MGRRLENARSIFHTRIQLRNQEANIHTKLHRLLLSQHGDGWSIDPTLTILDIFWSSYLLLVILDGDLDVNSRLDGDRSLHRSGTGKTRKKKKKQNTDEATQDAGAKGKHADATYNLLNNVVGAEQINDTLVNAHLEAIKSLGTCESTRVRPLAHRKRVRQFCTQISATMWEEINVPSPQGDLRVVMRKTLVGMRTGPLTFKRWSLAPRIKSAQTITQKPPHVSTRANGKRVEVKTKNTATNE